MFLPKLVGAQATIVGASSSTSMLEREAEYLEARGTWWGIRVLGNFLGFTPWRRACGYPKDGLSPPLEE